MVSSLSSVKSYSPSPRPVRLWTSEGTVELGRLLKYGRKLRKWSLPDLADAVKEVSGIKISGKAYGKIERGGVDVPGANTIRALHPLQVLVNPYTKEPLTWEEVDAVLCGCLSFAGWGEMNFEQVGQGAGAIGRLIRAVIEARGGDPSDLTEFIGCLPTNAPEKIAHIKAVAAGEIAYADDGLLAAIAWSLYELTGQDESYTAQLLRRINQPALNTSSDLIQLFRDRRAALGESLFLEQAEALGIPEEDLIAAESGYLISKKYAGAIATLLEVSAPDLLVFVGRHANDNADDNGHHRQHPTGNGV